MKKITLLLIAVCLLVGCSRKNEDNSIKYNGSKTIDIVLREELRLNATSNDPISYYSEDEMIVTVNANGVIYGKNIGETNVIIQNSENTIKVKVNVSLFEEPTQNFDISPYEIKKLYGAPNKNYGDSIFVYGGGNNNWYSYAVWEMAFFFIDEQYKEADLYIRSDLDIRLNEFLESKYHYEGISIDTLNGVATDYHIYLNDENPENASVLIGKIYNTGYQNEDICLFYIPYENKTRSNHIGIPEGVRKKIYSNRQ